MPTDRKRRLAIKEQEISEFYGSWVTKKTMYGLLEREGEMPSGELD